MISFIKQVLCLGFRRNIFSCLLCKLCWELSLDHSRVCRILHYSSPNWASSLSGVSRMFHPIISFVRDDLISSPCILDVTDIKTE